MTTRTDLGKIFITNGGEYDPTVTYEEKTFVLYKNSTYLALQTVTGIEPTDDRINWQLMARGFNARELSDVTANDTSGAIGNAGATVSAQSLVDWIADQVMTKVLKKTELVNNALANTPGIAALDAAMGKNFQGQINAVRKSSFLSNVDLNSIIDTGKYVVISPSAHSPGLGESFSLHVISNDTPSDVWCTQLAIGLGENGAKFRKKNNNGWSSWEQILTVGNPGKFHMGMYSFYIESGESSFTFPEQYITGSDHPGWVPVIASRISAYGLKPFVVSCGFGQDGKLVVNFSEPFTKREFLLISYIYYF